MAWGGPTAVGASADRSLNKTINDDEKKARYTFIKGQIYNRLQQFDKTKKKRLIHLICRVKGEKVYDETKVSEVEEMHYENVITSDEEQEDTIKEEHEEDAEAYGCVRHHTWRW